MWNKPKRKPLGLAKKAPKLQRVWSVYMARCADGTLYTGMTNNLPRRLVMHNAGKAAKYTRGRGPVAVVFERNGMTRPQALARERAIKALPRTKKEELAVACRHLAAGGIR